MTPELLFIIPSVGVGGAELQLMLQIRELRRRGLKPRLMVLSRRVDAEVLELSETPDSDILALGLSSAILDWAFLLGFARVLGRACGFAAAGDCRRIVALLPPAHFFSRMLKLALLARGRQVRLFQYHHSVENTLNPRDTAAKRVFHGINRLLARACDHAHWHVSRQVRDDIAAPPSPGGDEVLHNTCDMAAPGDVAAADALMARICGEASPYTLLLPGRLQAVKGHVLLIEACRRLVADTGAGPDAFRVLFAGEGPERGAIEVAVRDAGLQDHVALLGTVPHPVLLALYRRVDLVVVPSLFEGFGIAAIEAISRGTLVIASDAAGLAEVIRPGENALQFRAGDGEGLYRLLSMAWAGRGTPIIDPDAAREDVMRRFGLEAHLGRMLDLLGEDTTR